MYKTNHPLYKRWRSMKARCNDPKHESYPLYGGAGIKICAEWTDFWAFASDMGGAAFEAPYG